MSNPGRQCHPDFVKSLLSSGQYSDMVIVCTTDVHKVHKAVVCTQSKFFANAIKFPGQEENGKVALPADEPATVKFLVQYLYEGDYGPRAATSRVSASPPVITYSGFAYASDAGPPSRQKSPHTCPKTSSSSGCCRAVCPHHHCGRTCYSNCVNFCCIACLPELSDLHKAATGSADQLLTHSKMYAIADKYEVAGLGDMAKDKFKKACERFWNDPLFPTAAAHVFSSTPDKDLGLRDVVIDTIANHVKLVNKAEIFEFMAENATVAVSVLKKRVEAGLE